MDGESWLGGCGLTALEQLRADEARGRDFSLEELHELGEIASHVNDGAGPFDDLGYARPFDPKKWAEGPAWECFVDSVLNALKSGGLAVRQQQMPKYRMVLKVVLANLLSAHAQDENLYIAYSRRECGVAPISTGHPANDRR